MFAYVAIARDRKKDVSRNSHLWQRIPHSVFAWSCQNLNVFFRPSPFIHTIFFSGHCIHNRKYCNLILFVLILRKNFSKYACNDYKSIKVLIFSWPFPIFFVIMAGAISEIQLQPRGRFWNQLMIWEKYEAVCDSKIKLETSKF